MLTLPYDIVCGYFDCSEFEGMNLSPARTTAKFEIEFYLEDANSTFADGREYLIKKGYIQIAKPNQVRYSQLPFKTMYLKFCAENELADMLKAIPEYFCSSHYDRTQQKLQEIILLSEKSADKLLLQSRILSFIDLIIKDSKIPQTHSGSGYEIISRAKRFIEANYQNNIKLSDIAKSVNLSPIYFHNVFTSAYGASPHSYLIECRISEAKKLLWNTSVPLTQIAETCVFGCQQYFNKLFKQHTGVSPGKYRKEFQQSYIDK